ncbi:MAG: hypothetical protein O7H41_07920 [Planctomycetota bacterium]|nr:hypothetical protein [Planctomycetota bacterium]
MKLTDLHARVIVFTANTPLLIVLPGNTIYQEFVKIDVTDNIFRGMNDWGEWFTVNVDEVTSAGVKLFSGWRTFGLAMIIVGGAALLVALASVWNGYS